MKIQTRVLDPILHVVLEGDDSLDAVNAAEVKTRLLNVLDGSADLVLDLGGLDYVDSAGIGVLVSLLKSARVKGRTVVFTGVRSSVLSILEVIKLDRIFEIQPDLHMAVAAVVRARYIGAVKT